VTRLLFSAAVAVAAAALLALLPATQRLTHAQSPPALVIDGGTLIDGNGGRPFPIRSW